MCLRHGCGAARKEIVQTTLICFDGAIGDVVHLGGGVWLGGVAFLVGGVGCVHGWCIGRLLDAVHHHLIFLWVCWSLRIKEPSHGVSVDLNLGGPVVADAFAGA